MYIALHWATPRHTHHLIEHYTGSYYTIPIASCNTALRHKDTQKARRHTLTSRPKSTKPHHRTLHGNTHHIVIHTRPRLHSITHFYTRRPHAKSALLHTISHTTSHFTLSQSTTLRSHHTFHHTISHNTTPSHYHAPHCNARKFYKAPHPHHISPHQNIFLHATPPLRHSTPKEHQAAQYIHTTRLQEGEATQHTRRLINATGNTRQVS